MRARRIAWWALALAAACGNPAVPGPGPLDRIRQPTGLAVVDGRLLVLSSNADLLYDEETGGSVMSLELDPAAAGTVRIAGAINVRSFGGDLAVARKVAQDPAAPEPDQCGTALPSTLAVFGTRGSNTLNVVSVDAGGRLACERCGLAAGGPHGDPLAAAPACGAGRARAFVGYLSGQHGTGWVSELDLLTGAVRSAAVGAGAVRGFAYDVARDRLYLAGLATSVPTPLRWIELGGCTLGAPAAAGGCTVGEATLPSLPAGLELRAIALAHPYPGAPQRAYLTGRLYDAASAVTAGGRSSDLGGLLVVVDLLDAAGGGVEPEVVRAIPIGRGAQEVRVLPARPGRRDVVAALAVDDGSLWIYDDDTWEVATFGRDPVTGAPVLGHEPFGLAVDPALAGGTARIWVGAYSEGFVTPLDVPLDAPALAGFAGGSQRKITGGSP